MNRHSLLLGAEDEDFPRRFAQLPFGSQKHILAYGGDDGSISLVEGDEAKTGRRFSERIFAIACSHDGKRVAVGFGDGSTTIYLYKSFGGDYHPFLAALRKSNGEDELFSQIEGMEEESSDEVSFPGPRFQTPVRSLAFDPRQSNLLACGSEDSGFCIVDATSSESLSKKRFLAEESANEHNETGVRGLAYHVGESQTLLASLDLQGRLCVWDVSGDDPELEYELLHKDGHKCVTKVDQGDINESTPADQACFPVFGKSLLGLPGSNDLQVRLIDAVGNQHFVSSVDGQGHIDSIVSLAFSKDGCHTLSSGRDGRIVLWKMDKTDTNVTGEFMKLHAEIDSVCTHILWSDSTIYFSFENGTFSSIKQDDLLPTKVSKKSSVMKTSTKADETESSTNEGEESETPPKRLSKSTKTTDDSDDDLDFDDSDETKDKAKVSFIDEEADEDNVAPQHPTANENVEPMLSEQVTDDYEAIDDDDALAEDHESGALYRSNVAALELPEPQPAFAPSSTPLDLQRRIMCWNHVGTVTLFRGDEGVTRNTVNIDFTDSAYRRPLSFTDNMGFIVGSLGEEGAFFASDLADDMMGDQDDDINQAVDGLNMSDKTKAALRKSHRKRMNKDGVKATGSSIYFHRFETFGNPSSKDWVMNLPDGELALGCASGQGWAACITSRRFLRTFTSGGNQGPVIWLKGEPVTIVGRSRFVAVFYHEATPMPDGTQKLGYSIYDGVSGETISDGSLSCISSRSSLSWSGFSKEGSLMVMDSDGMLSMLAAVEKQDVTNDDKEFSWMWSPMLDTVGLRKSMEDSFWPVTAQDGKLICVPLKGGNEHPDAARRPVTTTLSLRMPLVNGPDKNSKLEEVSVRAKLALNQKKYNIAGAAGAGYDVTDLEEEYSGLCAQVDKVTLKLFMATAEAGKLERSIDLVQRLHLEKSFDIAITVAERMRHDELSDKIEDIKDRRFAIDEEEEAEDEMFPDTQPEKSAHGTPDRPSTRNISPETASGNKRPRDNVEDEELASTVRRKINPFAKKRMESPGRVALSPVKESHARIGISRLSSFSATSHEMSKISKKLL